MRSLIIIAVVVITFIAAALIMPMKKDVQPGAVVIEQRISAAADTSSVHAAQHAGGAITPKTDNRDRQSGGMHYAHRHRLSTSGSTSL